MKKIMMVLLVLTSLCVNSTYASVVKETPGLKEYGVCGHIDTRGLKAMIDSQIPFVLLDARGKMWQVDEKIPTAQLLSYKDSLNEAVAIIPHLDSLIVVYCFSSTCPYSGRLVKQLQAWGYSNIIEYTAGLKEWRDDAHYPIEKI